MIFNWCLIALVTINTVQVGSEGTTEIYNEAKTINTEVGKSFSVEIVKNNALHTTLSCHLADPNNELYEQSNIETVYNVVILQEQDEATSLVQACVANFGPITENMHGDWSLIAKIEDSAGEKYDVIQPFEIVIEGVTDLGEENEIILDEEEESDSVESTTTETPITTVNEDDDRIKLEDMTLTLGEQVITEFGPDNSDLCEVIDPKNVQTYRGFGKCMMIRDVVTADSAGEWSANIVLSGKMLVTEYKFTVNVIEPENTTVVTNVETADDGLRLSCSVLRDMPLNNCKFIRPDKGLVYVKEGVSDGRYSYHSVESNESSVNCGLHITEPEISDYGTWQCVMETEERRHSSFLRVNADASAVEDISTETVAESSAVTSVAGNSVSLKCTTPTKIEYCWFRAPNGTAFSVSPNVPSATYEYNGNGFDFGECGLTIKATSIVDSGTWACNTGITNSLDTRVVINVNIISTPLVMSAIIRHIGKMHVLQVTGKTYDGSPVNYCRFITPSGIGINSNVSMNRYSTAGSDLSSGVCTVSVRNPSFSELSPWTIAAQVVGSNEEILSRVQLVRTFSSGHGKFFFFFYWMLIFGLVALLIAIMIGSNRSARNWTRHRASTAVDAIRVSFRRKNNATNSNTSNENPPAYQP